MFCSFVVCVQMSRNFVMLYASKRRREAEEEGGASQKEEAYSDVCTQAGTCYKIREKDVIDFSFHSL